MSANPNKAQGERQKRQGQMPHLVEAPDRATIAATKTATEMNETLRADREKSRRQARNLLRAADRAILGTCMSAAQLKGWPYTSLVMLTVDHDLSPLLLLSDISEHTRNFRRDDRVSLTVDNTIGLDEPLTGSRITAIGRIREDNCLRARARYLARHPATEIFAGFKDFHLFRVTLERAHLIAGFGQALWLKAHELTERLPPVEEIMQAEAGILAHMNQDHAESVAYYAVSLLGLPAGAWKLVGVDSEGCDLRNDGLLARLPFDEPVEKVTELRQTLVDLAKTARKTAPPSSS